MHAEDRALGVVFEISVQLHAPLFQRPYVWKQETNWEPLWESIRTATTQRLTGSNGRPYFLGAIVLEQMPVMTGEVDKRQIIDGQQRLTTLQLAIAAIRDICAERGSRDYMEAFLRLSQNFIPSHKDPESKFKVWPTNVDQEHFKRAMNATGIKELKQRYGVKLETARVGHLIPDCYIYFSDEVTRWLEENTDMSLEDRLDILLQVIKKDLVLVVVDLGEKDDPQLIFETLNALGTPLIPADLVKNFLFHMAQREGSKIPDLYQQIWKPFDDDMPYWRKEIRQGRLKLNRIDIFLAHYLTLFRKEVVSMTQLFGEFRDYCFQCEGVSAEKQMRRLRDYADVFQRFDKYPEDSREGLFFRRLEVLDTNMAIPVLLEMLKKPEDEEDKDRFLEYLESYLVRRAVCGLTYKNYNRLFVEMIKHLSSTSYSSSELLKFLLTRKGGSVEWPSDEQFKNAVCGHQIYKNIKQARTRMVLESIERELPTGKTENIVIKEKLSIEHIMPQGWRPNWPLPDGSTMEDEIKRDAIIHQLGNLTLVTGKLNPSLSNASWDDKKKALMEHSALAMNRRLQTTAIWGEDSIAARNEELFEIMLKIWPKPSLDLPSLGDGPRKDGENVIVRAGEGVGNKIDSDPIFGQDEEPPQSGGRTVGLSEHQRIHRKFWEALLALEKRDATRFSGISPSKDGFIMVTSPITRVFYVFIGNGDDTRVQLELIQGDEKKNTDLFDYLYASRRQIEERMGSELIWDKKPQNNTCKIAKNITDVGHNSPEDKWPAIHEQMRAGMRRLEAALDPHLKEYKKRQL